MARLFVCYDSCSPGSRSKPSPVLPSKEKSTGFRCFFFCLGCFLFTFSIHGGRIVPLRMQTPSAPDIASVSQIGGLVKMS